MQHASAFLWTINRHINTYLKHMHVCKLNITNLRAHKFSILSQTISAERQNSYFYSSPHITKQVAQVIELVTFIWEMHSCNLSLGNDYLEVLHVFLQFPQDYIRMVPSIKPQSFPSPSFQIHY